MSYIRAPRLHQSTARLWPLLVRISGALKKGEDKRNKKRDQMNAPREKRSANEPIFFVLLSFFLTLTQLTPEAPNEPSADVIDGGSNLYELHF